MMAEKKVLVVDDEIHIVHVVVIKLRSNGFEVITASNGSEAFESACSQKPDIVVTDLQMPVMDGIEATQIIRSKISRTLPIIAMTASHDRERCISSGKNDFLEKPFGREKLEEQIFKWCGRK